MQNYINDKLRMLFICKDDLTMKMMAHKTMIELTDLMPGDEVPTILTTTYKELMSNAGRLSQVTNTERLDEVAEITIVTWFGIYRFYSYENGLSALLGRRVNVLVLDDELELQEEEIKDIIEPITSEYGDMILLSKFTQSESKTKYTQQLHRYYKQIHLDLVCDKFVGKGE